jgi:hypothetical protein
MQGFKQAEYSESDNVRKEHFARANRERKLAHVEDRETAGEISDFLRGYGIAVSAQMSQQIHAKDGD